MIDADVTVYDSQNVFFVFINIIISTAIIFDSDLCDKLLPVITCFIVVPHQPLFYLSREVNKMKIMHLVVLQRTQKVLNYFPC